MQAHGLVRDAARVMRANFYTVFLASLCYDRDCYQEDHTNAHLLLDKYVEEGTIPLFVYDFCLDIIIGRIPVFDKKGRKIN